MWNSGQELWNSNLKYCQIKESLRRFAFYNWAHILKCIICHKIIYICWLLVKNGKTWLHRASLLQWQLELTSSCSPAVGHILSIPQNSYHSCNMCLCMSRLGLSHSLTQGLIWVCNPWPSNLLKGFLNCGACKATKEVPSHHLAFSGVYLLRSYGLGWVWMLAPLYTGHIAGQSM